MVVTANTVTRVNKGQIMVILINLNDKQVSMNKGSKLCTTNPYVSKGEVNTLREEKHQGKGKYIKPLVEDDIECGDSTMKPRLLELLDKYREATWKKGEPLGHYKGDAMPITLTDPNKIVNLAPYKIPHARQEQLDK